MTIEVLNTGTELMLGNTLNTHGAWLGRELFKLGLRVARQTTVPDGEAITTALREACARADVVIVTGGLGPTSDDITREAVAAVFGLELCEDAVALESIRAFFAKRGRPMAEANRKQALVPEGGEMLPNPNGTAPGVYQPPGTATAACAVFLLPGPPREMQPMFTAEVVPRLKALAGLTDPPRQLELKFAGIGESDFHQGIDEALAAVPGLEYGYCARVGEVDLRLIGSAEAVEEGRRIALGGFAARLISDDGSSIEETVVNGLGRRGWKLATAESCTGGLISHRVTNVPGASAVFTHGFVTYANDAKVECLGVRREDLATHGAVSETVARQMAEGALRVSGADVAVAVTGIAGPDGGSAEKPVGTVFLALAVKEGQTRVERQFHPRSRDVFKQAVSQAALAMLVAQVRDLRSSVGQVHDLPPPPPVHDLPPPSPVHDLPPPSPPPLPVFRPPTWETNLITRKRRRLPHWNHQGACHFVTLRLADSVPAAAMEVWDSDRRRWCEIRGYDPSTSHDTLLDELTPKHWREYARMFGRTFHALLDAGHGECLLEQDWACGIVEERMGWCNGSDYVLGDYVIMPNHVHALLVPTAGQNVGTIVGAWKKHSARLIHSRLGRSGGLWQHESYDHVVRDRRELEAYRKYIRDNPVKAGGRGRVRECEWLFEGEGGGS